MITRTPAYQTSDNQTWPTLKLAQEHELELLFTACTLNASTAFEIAQFIVEHADTVVDILTTTAAQAEGNASRTS